jgi:GTPase SAR1 family protein
MSFCYTTKKNEAFCIAHYPKKKRFVTFKFKDQIKESDELIEMNGPICKNSPDLIKYEMIPYKPKNQRMAVYISGPSGSGKSTFAGNLIKKLIDQSDDEERDVNVFSVSGVFDPAFEPIKKNVIMYEVKNPAFLELSIYDLEDSILLFDDYNTSDDQNPGIRHAYTLQKEALEMGRKLGIDVVVINHKTRQNQKTLSVIDESETFVLFPACNMEPVQNFTKEKIGVKNKKIIDAIGNCDSYSHQPLVIRKVVPRVLFSDQLLCKI